MPREYVCRNPICPESLEVASATPPSGTDPLPCGSCGWPMEIALYPIACVWVGQITSKYLDKKKEGGYAKDGGHYFWDRDPVTGKSSPVWCDSWSKQKELCRRNKVALPSEMPNNFEVAKDGRTVLNTIGLPGTEV